jgi:hypothetical protein
MPKVTEEGRYVGRVVDQKFYGKTENGRLRSLAWQARLELRGYQGKQKGSWVNLERPVHITAFCNMLKLDGTKNLNTLQNMKKITGWDGLVSAPSALNDVPLENYKDIEATIEWDDDRGDQGDFVVKWLNPAGESQPNSAEDLQNFDAAWGAAGVAKKPEAIKKGDLLKPGAEQIPEDSIPF